MQKQEGPRYPEKKLLQKNLEEKPRTTYQSRTRDLGMSLNYIQGNLFVAEKRDLDKSLNCIHRPYCYSLLWKIRDGTKDGNWQKSKSGQQDHASVIEDREEA
jgi:hypothetical protein